VKKKGTRKTKRKVAKRKGTRKKSTKKKAVKRKTTKRRAVKKKTVRKKTKKLPRKAAPEKKKPMVAIGVITHYFPHVKAGVLKIKKGSIAVGDTLHIKGHTTDFKQKVNSMQLDHAPIQKAGKGKEIGIYVKSRVRQNDAVYKFS